jgi:hypothetical protein
MMKQKLNRFDTDLNLYKYNFSLILGVDWLYKNKSIDESMKYLTWENDTINYFVFTAHVMVLSVAELIVL